MMNGSGKPIGSECAEDLAYNNKALDRFTNAEGYFENRKGSNEPTLDTLKKSYRPSVKFKFSEGGTIQSDMDLGIDDNDDTWVYKGVVPQGGLVISPGTDPSAEGSKWAKTGDLTSNDVKRPDGSTVEDALQKSITSDNLSSVAHNSLGSRSESGAHPATAIITNSGKSVEQVLAEIPNSIDPEGTAKKLIDEHNADPNAHPALREFITAEADRAEEAADLATSSADIYSSVSDGLNGTEDGDFFWVVSSDDKKILDLYKNVNGSGVDQNKSTGSSLKYVELTNIAKNQNYANDNDIRYRNAIGSVSNNELSFTSSAAFGQAYQTCAFKANHKYYVAQRVLSNNATPLFMDVYDPVAGKQLGKKDNNGVGAYDYVDMIVTDTSDATVEIRFVQPSSGFTQKLKETVIIDLTESYGAGKEPSIEEFRSALSEHNDNSVFLTGKTLKVPADYQSKGGNYYIDIEGDNLTIIQKFSETHDLKMNFNRFFPNYIWNLKNVYLVSSSGNNPSTELIGGTRLIENGTDTLGPYRVKAINNIDGDNPSSLHFTGGSHGYLNNYNIVPANTPTAKSNNLGFRVNGQHVTKFTGFCRTVEVNWNNSVQATNTKKSDGSGRYVLAEDYCMYFDGYQYNVKCQITALEDITIDLYYGLQMQLLSIFDDEAFYHTAENDKWNVAKNTSSNSGSLTCDKITIKSGSTYLDMSLDNTTGLGKIKRLNGVDFNAFITPYNKAYFYLINDTSFDSGTVLTYSGSYRFYGK